jgi:hypothetical protein
MKQYHDALPGRDIGKSLGIPGIDYQRAFHIGHRPVTGDAFGIRVRRSNRLQRDRHGDRFSFRFQGSGLAKSEFVG